MTRTEHRIDVDDQHDVDTLPTTGELLVAPKRYTTPLGRLVVEYVKGRVARQEVTRPTARRSKTILGFLADVHGQQPVDRFGPHTIDRWRGTRTHLAPTSLRKEISEVRQFCLWLQRERKIRNDPMIGCRPVKVPRSVPRALTRDEVDRLWSVLPDLRAQAIVALMLGCGLRRIEVLRLQVGDWDRREQTLFVKGKGGHERVLPVPPWVAAILEVYVQSARWGPMIRTHDGTRGISQAYIGRMMQGWLTDAGVKAAPHDGKACHSLRHTLASEVADVEPDLRVLQQILGHQNLTSTQIYLRRAAMDQMRDAMVSAATNVTDTPSR